jgi:hypothetical protein
MNWVKGLFRIWLASSLLWLGVTGYYAVRHFAVPAPFYGNYQYNTQLKEMPWKTDWSKPLYEIAYAPGKGTFPETFYLMAEDLAQKWDGEVKAGRMIEISFPDRTHLYLAAQLTKDDQTFLAQLFWSERWWRYASKILPWLALVLGPPLGFLALGILILWVGRGFRADPVG